MKCPYCGNEMEQGFIQSPQEISWKKGDKRIYGAWHQRGQPKPLEPVKSRL